MIAPSQPPPLVEQRRWWVRLRSWKQEKVARTDKFRSWLYFKAWKWVLAVFVAYMLAACRLGYTKAWEVLVGRESPKDAPWPWVTWPLSIFGWMLIPAFIGGVAGYVVTAQIEARRSASPAEAAGELREAARRPGAPPHRGQP
ncbi:DUF6313 family protein [Streptomyces sp. NBC_01310]|uniref:DUF6313 family protein n=1 Tax=Streptomyces sp. NBC_01310 TaxID=2903820 RepID=UPI0035B602C0